MAPAAQFPGKGKWVRRVDVRAQWPARSVDVCVPLPKAGQYAFVVRHDANANRKSDWNDGGGFSRNPKLSLMGKPSFGQTAVTVQRPGTDQRRDELSQRPVGEAGRLAGVARFAGPKPCGMSAEIG